MIKAGIIGFPVKHSRSPLIHGFWLKEKGIDGRYDHYEVTPEGLPAFVEKLEAENISGFNITIPHKEAIMPHLDDISAQAIAIGAVNTVWRESGKWRATNTDGIGFIKNCDKTAPHWEKHVENALVIGAGGGARAIVYGLLEKGIPHVTLINRNRERAEELKTMNPTRITVQEWESMNAIAYDAQMIVNTTALGMEHQDPLPFVFPKDNAHRVVSDIVYVPLLTPFLQQAQARGDTVIGGLGMLLHQAVPGFEKWFHVKPTVTNALEQHILKCMEA